MPAKRTYTSTLRAAQAGETRSAILAAANALCAGGSWSAVTIATIAASAGVSKETIYAVFGNKVALMREMVTSAVAEAVPGAHFLDGERPRAIRAEPGAARQIALWARYLAEILGRVAPLMAVIRGGAESEPEMQALYVALHRGRRANIGIIAQGLHECGLLRPGLSAETATDILWQLASPEAFTLLAQVEGYTLDRYAAWLTARLHESLLASA